MSNPLAERVAATVRGNVRAELARAGVSQTRVAEHLGQTQAAISRRLSGHVAFTIDELVEIAHYLRIPLSVLIGEHAAELAC